MVTNLGEIVQMRNKTAAHIALLLENNWFARWSSPKKCMCDQGNEFLGADFQKALRRHEVEPVAAATKNPQANSMIQRLHQTIASSLRLLVCAHPPMNEAEKRRYYQCSATDCVLRGQCRYSFHNESVSRNDCFWTRHDNEHPSHC